MGVCPGLKELLRTPECHAILGDALGKYGVPSMRDVMYSSAGPEPESCLSAPLRRGGLYPSRAEYALPTERNARCPRRPVTNCPGSS